MQLALKMKSPHRKQTMTLASTNCFSIVLFWQWLIPWVLELTQTPLNISQFCETTRKKSSWVSFIFNTMACRELLYWSKSGFCFMNCQKIQDATSKVSEITWCTVCELFSPMPGTRWACDKWLLPLSSYYQLLQNLC